MYAQKQPQNMPTLKKKSAHCHCIQKMSVHNEKGEHYRMKQIVWILNRIHALNPDIDMEKTIAELIAKNEENGECKLLLNSLAADGRADKKWKDLQSDEALKKRYIKIDQVTMLQQRTLPAYLVGPDDYKIDALHCIAGKANMGTKYGPHMALTVKSDTIYVAINTNNRIAGNDPRNFEEPIHAIQSAISGFKEEDIKKYEKEQSSCSEFLNHISKYSTYKQTILDYVKKLQTKTVKRVYYDNRQGQKRMQASETKTASITKMDTGGGAMHGEVLIADYLQEDLGGNLAVYTKNTEKMEARREALDREKVLKTIRIGGSKINCWDCHNHLNGPIKKRYTALQAGPVSSTDFNQTKFDGYLSPFGSVTDVPLREEERSMQSGDFEGAMHRYLAQQNKTAANKAYMLAIAQYREQKNYVSLEQLYIAIGSEGGLKRLASDYVEAIKKLLGMHIGYIRKWQELSKKYNRLNISNQIGPVKNELKKDCENFEAICGDKFKTEKKFLADLDKYVEGDCRDNQKIKEGSMEKPKATYETRKREQRELVNQYENMQMVKQKTIQKYL